MTTLTLSPLFGDHAVLQRDVPLPIWGAASPGTTVTVSLAGKSQSAVAGDDGRWRVSHAPLPAGGPHTLSVRSGAESLTRSGIHIGEVWLCAGQSNMQWTVAQCRDAESEAAAAVNFPRLHFFVVPKEGAAEPQSEFMSAASWLTCSPEAAQNFSSLAYGFGRELHTAPTPALAGVAIGLIDCSYGGTKIEAWMSRAWLDAYFPGEPLRDSIFGLKPTAIFNGMVAPLAPIPVRGVLWYQGESNTAQPAQYGRLLTGFIAEWRERWARPDLPFLLVQLPNWRERIENLHFTWIREQQARAAAADSHVHMAVAIDAGDDADLHPADKRPIARRLALLARAHVYDEKIVADSPAYQSHEFVGGAAHVKFANAHGGLVNANAPGPLRGFALAGEDGKFFEAVAIIEGVAVVLRHKEIPAPRFIRYAWEGAPQADLRNGVGLPAAPFRTDDFQPAP